MNDKPTYIVFDISNVLYRCFYANPDNDEITTAGLAHHAALTTLTKYYNQYKPDRVIMTFDRPNWRVDYTKSKNCISGRVYKGHRRQTMTPAELDKYNRFKEHLTEFETFMREHTAIPCLAAKGLEADDLMAGIAQQYHETANVILISADKDLMQLLRYPSVTLIDPATDKKRTLEEYDNDADLFMFIKCFRGDAGDNVQSAYPRVRMTKLLDAYNDPYVHTTLLEHVWIDANGNKMRVKDLVAENELLMDLNKQPDDIKWYINDTIEEGLNNPGKYSYFHFIKFCNKYELNNILDSAEKFAGMLSQKAR